MLGLKKFSHFKVKFLLLLYLTVFIGCADFYKTYNINGIYIKEDKDLYYKVHVVNIESKEYRNSYILKVKLKNYANFDKTICLNADIVLRERVDNAFAMLFGRGDTIWHFTGDRCVKFKPNEEEKIITFYIPLNGRRPMYTLLVEKASIYVY